MTRVSCNTFASLVCASVTSTNQFNRDKSSATFKLVVASVSNNNALSFNDKSSSTFKLDVVSVINKFLNGPTNASPAKQHPVSNDDPAIERSLQLHVPMTLTFERSIEAFPIFQLIDVSIPDENDSCIVFQMVAYGHNTFIESTSFNDSFFQLVVELISILISEGAQFTPATLQTFKLIVGFEKERAHWSKPIVGCSYYEISFHFCKDCRIFCEGVKDNGGIVVKQRSANNLDADKMWRRSSKSNNATNDERLVRHQSIANATILCNDRSYLLSQRRRQKCKWQSMFLNWQELTN